jgi:hypothetical protein
MKRIDDVVQKIIEVARERDGLSEKDAHERIIRLSGYLDALTWVLG